MQGYLWNISVSVSIDIHMLVNNVIKRKRKQQKRNNLPNTYTKADK